ncbi:hypothetical protein D9M72_478300 [compost metagenome]
MPLATVEGRCQSAAFFQRGMRAADGDELNLGWSLVEMRPGLGHVGTCDGRLVGILSRGTFRFRGHAFHMQHGGRGCRAEGGAERLQVVARRLCGSETAQKWNAVGRGLAGEVADQRPEGIVDTIRQFHVDDALRPARFVEIDTRKGRAAGQRDAEVEKIRMFRRTGAKHGVGEDDGVGFRPGNGFA